MGIRCLPSICTDIVDAVVSRLDHLLASSPEEVPTGVEDQLAVAAAVTGAVPPGGTTAGPGPPGGLDPDTSDRLASCLARTVGWMFHARDQGRTAHLTLACLNHWLAEYGPDLPAERLAAIHTEVFPYIRRTWQDNRLPRLKVGPRKTWVQIPSPPATRTSSYVLPRLPSNAIALPCSCRVPLVVCLLTGGGASLPLPGAITPSPSLRAAQESLVVYLLTQLQLGTLGVSASSSSQQQQQQLPPSLSAGEMEEGTTAAGGSRAISPAPSSYYSAFSLEALQDLMAKDIEAGNVKW